MTISSNGTMVNRARARAVAAAGVRYVGISIDGNAAEHDAFRGRRGAHRRALAGIAALKEEDVRVGVRVTLTATAIAALPDIFAMVEREGIDRACFYHHLVPAGRGVSQEAVATPGVRGAVESIFGWAEDLVARDAPVEVLTVDNYADGPALYLRQLRRDPRRAMAIRARLSWNGGARNASGVGLAAVDWEGRVKPDQFWGGPLLGSVRGLPLPRPVRRWAGLAGPRLGRRARGLGPGLPPARRGDRGGRLTAAAVVDQASSRRGGAPPGPAVSGCQRWKCSRCCSVSAPGG